jgi:hypothetical protein
MICISPSKQCNYSSVPSSPSMSSAAEGKRGKTKARQTLRGLDFERLFDNASSSSSSSSSSPTSSPSSPSSPSPSTSSSSSFSSSSSATHLSDTIFQKLKIYGTGELLNHVFAYHPLGNASLLNNKGYTNMAPNVANGMIACAALLCSDTIYTTKKGMLKKI